MTTVAFNPVEHPICLANPHRHAPSAWLEHIPFGIYLVDLLRPRLIVELGTHHETSSSAFCLHGIDVCIGDFGVWRLWEEITHDYRHVVFHHGHGLGLICPGAIPAGLETILDAGNEQTTMIRDFFFLLSSRLQQAAEIEHLKTTVRDQTATITRLQQQLRAGISAPDGS